MRTAKIAIAACLLMVAGCSSGPDLSTPSRSRLEPASRVWRVANVSTAWRACGLPYAQRRLPSGRYRVLFLTARHFTEGLDTSSRYSAYLRGTLLLNGRELSVHPSQDAAVIAFNTKDPVALVTLTYRPLCLGELVWVAGYGGRSGELWISQGLASAPDRCTAPIYFGDSGGAVITRSGSVAGIVISMGQGKVAPIRHHCRFVPLPRIRRWLPKP